MSEHENASLSEAEISDFNDIICHVSEVGCNGKCKPVCDECRCRAYKANGERCTRRISKGHVDYCASHSCVVRVSENPLVACSARAGYYLGEYPAIVCEFHASTTYEQWELDQFTLVTFIYDPPRRKRRVIRP